MLAEEEEEEEVAAVPPRETQSTTQVHIYTCIPSYSKLLPF